ncbi:MAG: hypothetical protein PHW00_02540 [Clostridia bacterium]|nr:hypothetical protein [Clostridia bacterium]
MELWIALIGTCTAVITIALTNYYAKRNQLKFEERKLKEQYYTTFIEAVSNSVISNHAEQTRDALADAQNKLLLVGSPEVVKDLMVFHDYVKPSATNFTVEKHDELLTALLKSMRKDLFSNKDSNKNYPTIHLTGKSNSRK